MAGRIGGERRNFPSFSRKGRSEGDHFPGRSLNQHINLMPPQCTTHVGGFSDLGNWCHMLTCYYMRALLLQCSNTWNYYGWCRTSCPANSSISGTFSWCPLCASASGIYIMMLLLISCMIMKCTTCFFLKFYFQRKGWGLTSLYMFGISNRKVVLTNGLLALLINYKFQPPS